MPENGNFRYNSLEILQLVSLLGFAEWDQVNWILIRYTEAGLSCFVFGRGKDRIPLSLAGLTR